MAFRVKNLLKHETTLLGFPVGPLKQIDLQQYTDTATIIDSLLNGELYSKIYGKTAAISTPAVDLYSLGLTDEQLNFIARTGFLMGFQGYPDEIKPPFLFNHDGYLQVNVQGIELEIGDELEVSGQDAHDAPITSNPILTAAEAKSFTGSALTAVDADQDVTRIAATRQGVVYATITNPDGSKSIVEYEGAASASGDGGVPSLAVTKDALSELSNADGEYTFLTVDGYGALYSNARGQDAHDAPITSNPILTAAEAKSFTGTALTSVSADQDVTRIAATRQGIIYTVPTNPDGSKTSIQADGYAFAAGQGGTPILAVKRTTVQPLSNTDGQYTFPVVDGYGALYTQELSLDNVYTTVRTLSTTTADSEPPVDGSFISLHTTHSNSFVEVSYNITAVAGTVPPTQVRFKTWRATTDGTIEKIDDFVIDSSVLVLTSPTNPLRSRTKEFNAKRIFVTVTFPDGTSPNITGTVKARLVSPSSAGLQRSDLTFDATSGDLVVRPRGYESVTDTIKNTPTVFEADLALSEALVIDTTGLTAGSEVYYPSADGVEMLPYDSLLFEYSLTGANNGYVEAWWEATIGTNAWTQRNVVTTSGSDLILGGRHPSGKINTTVNGTIAGCTNFENCNFTRYRMVVKPITGNSGAVKLSLRRKVR